MMRVLRGKLRLLCAALLIAGCSTVTGSRTESEVTEFLTMYNLMDQRLATISNEADWKAVTDVNDQHTGERIGADRALAAFRGSRYVIDKSKTFLSSRKSLPPLLFRQLDNILLAAAESPGTIPDIVAKRIETEARTAAIM